MSKLTAETVLLCAVNEGTLYGEHCAMAQRNASIHDWKLHILRVFMPIYRRSEPQASLSYDEANKAAAMLHEHYAQHIAEMSEINKRLGE